MSIITENNLLSSNDLAILQKADAIDCYICKAGTDGCDPSFENTDSGVVSTSQPNATYCTVRISLLILKESNLFFLIEMYVFEQY